MSQESFNQKRFADFLSELCYWSNRTSSAALQMAIGEFRKNFSMSQHEGFLVEKIIDQVCTHYNITQKALRSSSRKMPLPEARKISIVLLQEHTGISKKKLASLFMCNRVMIHRAPKEFTSMNPDIKQHRDIIETHQKINKLIISIKQQSIS